MHRSILLFAALLSSTLVFAQKDYKTGTLNINSDLNNINIEANANIKLFKSDLSIKYSKSMNDINKLFELKMDPAEVFLALEIGKQTNKSVTEVSNIYVKNKDKGWGYIAKEMGIKPGSPEFHALKNSSKSKGNKAKGGKGKSQGNGNGKGNGKKK